MDYDVSFVDTPGATLLVRTAGPIDGYPLVLLHGWPDTGEGWAQVAPLLAERFRLIVPDNRGFGRSSMPEGVAAYRMQVLLADLVALLDWAEVARAGVVGHDFGGAVAWSAGTALTDRIDRIVTIAVPHPLNWKAINAARIDQLQRSFYVWLLNLGDPGERLLASGDFEMLLDYVYGDVLTATDRDRLRASWSEPGRFHAMAEWYRAAYRPDLLNPDTTLDLPPVRVPTRYIHGMQDWAFVPELAVGNGLFVEAEYDEVFVPDGTHWLMLTHPELIADLVTDWMA